MTASLRVRALVLLWLALGNGCNCSKGVGLAGDFGQLQTLTKLEFGNVPVNQKVRLILPVHNVGSAAVDILTQTIAGSPSFGRGPVVPLGKTLSAGALDHAALQFAPTAAGPFSGTLTIGSDGLDSPTTVALSGTGIQIDLQASPTTIDFGAVQVGATSSQCGTSNPCQVKLTNLGASAVQLSLDASQTAPQFQIAGSTGPIGAGVQIPLAANESYLVDVSFRPSAVGSISSAFNWVVSGIATPIPLHGQGVTGSVNCVPNPIAFGVGAPVDTGAVATQAITCRNAGQNPVTVSCLSLASQNGGTPNTACGVGSGVFAFTGQPPGLPLSLAAAGAGAGPSSFSFTLAYTASGGSGDADQLDVDFSSKGTSAVSTSVDPITGNQKVIPCTLSVSPTNLSFGTVTPGTPAVRSTTVSNLGGGVCMLSGLALDPTSDPAFTLDPHQATSLTIAAGGSATLTVDFNLASAMPPNQRKGLLTFTSNDAKSSGQIPLLAYLATNTPYARGWPKWHNDNNNSGKTESDTSNNTGQVAWSYQLANSGTVFGGGVSYINSPVIGADPGGTTYAIYQVSTDGNLFSFNPQGGVNWQVQLSDPTGDTHPSTPVVLKDGTIFVNSGTEQNVTNYYHLSASGQLIDSNSYQVEGFSASPTLDKDGDLFQADDDGIPPPGDGSDPFDCLTFQINAGGQVQLNQGLQYPFSPNAQPGTLERFGVVVNDDDSSFWCVEGNCIAITAPSAGFQLVPGWPQGGIQVGDPSQYQVISDLAIDRASTGNLYVYAAWIDDNDDIAGQLQAVNPANGAIIWSYSLPSGAGPSNYTQPAASAFGNAAPAVDDDGTVFVGTGQGLVAIDGTTGMQKWLAGCQDVVSAPAIGGDSTVFFGCSDGTFYAVNGATGAQKWVVNGAVNVPASGSPAIADDGTVFYVSDDGVLRAIR